ncbi:MAG: HD domain-containing protein, partial [Kiritimatiellae bacterium]|nr:HD domain-containing protein [Kiritimatiellia bacterium]
AKVAWAVLLHDIGKPGTARNQPLPDGGERIQFHGHPEHGARMAESICRRLKFSNDDRETIVRCVAEHMRFCSAAQMRKSTLLQWAAKPWMDTLLEVHRLDRSAGGRNMDAYELVRRARDELRGLSGLPPRKVDGRALMREGVPAGPAMKQPLEEIYRIQLEHPDWTPEELLRAWRAARDADA